jgi:hypothetical protein
MKCLEFKLLKDGTFTMKCEECGAEDTFHVNHRYDLVKEPKVRAKVMEFANNHDTCLDGVKH